MTEPLIKRWRKWVGIDPATTLFCQRVVLDGRVKRHVRSRALAWLASCRDAGFSTGLDADFSDPALAGHLEALSRAPVGPLRWLKAGVAIYRLAEASGERPRGIPLPAFAAEGWAVSAAEARARLPATDQAKLLKIEQIVRTSSLRQWQGLGARMCKGPDGRKHKATVSISTANMQVSTVNFFLRHAYSQKWRPYTLAGLLTPKRVTNFLYYSSTWKGEGLSDRTIEMREHCLLDFFYRGRDARPNRVAVIDAKRDAAIRKAMAVEHAHPEHWNRNPRKRKHTPKAWTPDRDDVKLLIGSLEEEIERIDERRARGAISEYGYWLDLRDAVLMLCTLFCMWIPLAPARCYICVATAPPVQLVTQMASS